MGTIVRGPNVPLHVVGGLRGYLYLRFQNCNFDNPKKFEAARLVLWGLTRRDQPHIPLPFNDRVSTVVCPVVNEWRLLEDYLRQSGRLTLEISKRGVTWTAVVELKFPLATSRDEAAVVIASIIDPRMERKGDVEVAVWTEEAAQKLGLDNNKRRRLIPEMRPSTSITSILDVFDALENAMSRQGMRLVDMYRFCNKLNTPVADLTSLLDRFVDQSTPVVHRKQFWDLMDPSGSRLFTFAEFNKKFKNARRVVCTVRNAIKMEVPVGQRFQAVYKDLIEVQKQRLYIDMDAQTVVGHLRRCDANVTTFDEGCLLVTLYVKLPQQTSWTLEEIRYVLKLKPITDPESEMDSVAVPIDDLDDVDELAEGHEGEPSAERDVQGDNRSVRSWLAPTLKSSDWPSSTSFLKPTLHQKDSPTRNLKPFSVDDATNSATHKQTIEGAVVQSLLSSRQPLENSTPKMAQCTNEPLINETDVSRVADDLILKCRHLMNGLSSCAQSMAASVEDIQSIVPVDPLSNGEQSIKFDVLMPASKSGIGLPDDPDQLIEDVLFRSLFLEKKGSSMSRMSMPIREMLTRMQPAMPSCLVGSESQVAADHEQGWSIWQRLIVHRLSIKEAVISLVIKSSTSTHTLQDIKTDEEMSAWISPVDKASDNIVLEVRAHHQPKGSSNMANCTGVATVTADHKTDQTECTTGTLLDNVSRPVVDVFTGQRQGTITLSLLMEPKRTTKGTAKGMAQQMHQLSGEPSSKGGDQRDQTFNSDPIGCSNQKEQPAGSVTNHVQHHDHGISQEDSHREVGSTNADTRQPCSESEEKLHLKVLAIRLTTAIPDFYLECYLEKASDIVYRSRYLSASVSQSSIPIDFERVFVVPTENEDWLNQSLHCRVVSVSEDDGITEMVGALELDLSCVRSFGRICGPMGIVDRSSKKTGEIDLDIHLLSNAVTSVIPPHLHQDIHALPIEESVQTKMGDGLGWVPLLTCSDDEDYVVFDDIDANEHTSRFDELDDICEIFSHSMDVHTEVDVSVRDVHEALYHPFFCDDAMLDFTKPSEQQPTFDDTFEVHKATGYTITGEMDIPEAVSDALCEASSNVDVGRIDIQIDPAIPGITDEQPRTQSLLNPAASNTELTQPSIPVDDSRLTEQTNKNILDVFHNWTLTDRALGDTYPSTERDSDVSVDIDDLLRKYNIERGPGWWTSLADDDDPSTTGH